MLSRGGISIFNGGSTIASPTIRNCTFDFDSSTFAGGAIHCTKNAQPTIEDCSFSNNYALHKGGALMVGSQSGIDINLSSSLFFDNKSGDQSTGSGGALHVEGVIAVSNCTIAENDAFRGSGMAVSGSAASITFSKNIVAFNLNEGIHFIDSLGSISYDCNDFYSNENGNFAGESDSTDVDSNSIFEDPLFCDMDNNNYDISSLSPCDEDSSFCSQLIGAFDDNCTRCCNLAGDVNNDGQGPNAVDLTYMVDDIFRGGPDPPCEEEADVNGSGTYDIVDLVYMVDFIFRGGAAPICP